jgi:hypothetical protein
MPKWEVVSRVTGLLQGILLLASKVAGRPLNRQRQLVQHQRVARQVRVKGFAG